MPAQPASDPRAVMTLDAGGTNFKFSAIRGNRPAIEPFSVPSNAHDLDACLATLFAGFENVRRALPDAPAAISFAFPGPADYEHGIISNVGNLPAFRGAVPLGPILEDKFGIPVFINNDGDLFAYGEAIAGLLPETNAMLAAAGSPKRFRNLVGITLGTGFGGGIVTDGKLLRGDNICAGEIWLLRHKLQPETNAEEGASIRAVRRAYATAAGIEIAQAPEPAAIFAIGMGTTPGNQAAARAAFSRLGEVAGDALAHALTLMDGLAVVGGGISGAWPLFLPALVAELNSHYHAPDGIPFRRLAQHAFNLEDPVQLKAFLSGDIRAIPVPGSSRTIACDLMPRTGIGISRLGTSQAVAIGAYAFALAKLP